MRALLHRSLILLAGACSVAVPLIALPVEGAGADSSGGGSQPLRRWARFQLNELSSSGDLQVGRSVNMEITLGGVVQSSVPVVAICESVLFESQTITLEPDAESMTLKGTVALEPLRRSVTSVHPKAARVQVTFARLRQNKLERLMRRIVYVTLERQEPPGDSSETAPVGPEETASVDLAEETQPDVSPVSSGDLMEEDLMPFADPGRGRAYWQHVSHLISRSWARQVRGIRKAPSSETVRVRFRLYPSGRAQLIEIEKGSGAREIDEAGIYAVVNAQPFPPLPGDLGDESVDVHIRMRTGARSKPKEIQSVTNQSDGKAGTPPSAGKK